MKFFIVSDKGDGAGLAIRLRQEDNEVRMYFLDPYARLSLEGIVVQVSSIPEGLAWKPDVVVFDMVGMGVIADKIKKSGILVIGGGSFHDKLELDRAYAIQVMETFGINVPSSFAFDRFTDAASFAARHPRKLVLKPSFNKNTAYTYVPRSNDDLIEYMAFLTNRLGVDGKVMLQEFVPGTEVSTEVWYSNGKPIAYPNSTIETKKFLHGDSGPSTGCQTSAVWTYPVREPRIVQTSLKKLNFLLDKYHYTGPLDINGIVRNGKFYGLEFTPRFGYSAIYAFIRLLKEELGHFLHRIAKGDETPISFEEGIGYSLRVTLSPYPFKMEDPILNQRIYSQTRGYYIGGLSPADWRNDVFGLDVYAQESGIFTAGVDGVICECTGIGTNVYEAEKKAVGLFKKMELPNKQARLGDGAKIATQRMFDLKEMGYDVPNFVNELELKGSMTNISTYDKMEKPYEKKEFPLGPDHMATTTLSVGTK